MYRGGDGIARKHHCDCVWLYVYDCVCVWHEYAATAPGSTTQLYHDSAATTPWTSNRQTHRHHHRWWRLLNQLRHTHTASTLAAGRHRSQRHLKPTPSHREPVSPRHATVDSSGRLHRGSITSIAGMVARRGTLSHGPSYVVAVLPVVVLALLLPPPRRPPPHLGIVGWCGQLAWTVTSSP